MKSDVTRRNLVIAVITSMVLGAACEAVAQVPAAKRSGASGHIDSVDPCGAVSGVESAVTFTAKASFSGEGFASTAKPHTIVLRLLVLDEDGNIVGSAKKEWEVPDGEHGCIKCPVTCQVAMPSGVYFINATLTDVGPDGTKVKLDAKACAVIVTK